MKTDSQDPAEPTPETKQATPSQQSNYLAVVASVGGIVFLALGAMLFLRSKVTRSAPDFEASAHMATPPGAGPVDLAMGSQVPDFVVRQFGSNDWQKLSTITGKVTMINFWASWCEACIQEMPSILKLREGYQTKGLKLVAISLDEQPDKDVPRMLKKLKIDFPVYTDPEGKIAELFDVHAIPLTVILDSNRKILMIENAELDWDSESMHTKLEKWLSG
jgi:thiol-disulfide isomerase/thioredoxin